jgi:hypothetical protein
VRAGLEEEDEVYLVPPSDMESYRLSRIDPEIMEKLKAEAKMAHHNSGGRR